MRELSLFTGAGGGLLGSKLLGFRSVGYVEWDETCQKIIAQRIKDEILEKAPIFTDVREFIQSGAARQYRGFVDLVSAGIPCQPHSRAGKQLGALDERDMLAPALDTICEVRPKYILLENNPGILDRGYAERLVAGLAGMGYVGHQFCLSAARCGANHQRLRVWWVAVDSNAIGNIEEQPHDGKTGRMGGIIESLAWDRDWEDALREFRGMDDGLDYRVDRLDTIRNGQVPVVAASAFRLGMNIR